MAATDRRDLGKKLTVFVFLKEITPVNRLLKIAVLLVVVALTVGAPAFALAAAEKAPATDNAAAEAPAKTAAGPGLLVLAGAAFGAGLVTLGAGIGIGLIGSRAVESMARRGGRQYPNRDVGHGGHDRRRRPAGHRRLFDQFVPLTNPQVVRCGNEVDCACWSRQST